MIIRAARPTVSACRLAATLVLPHPRHVDRKLNCQLVLNDRRMGLEMAVLDALSSLRDDDAPFATRPLRPISVCGLVSAPALEVVVAQAVEAVRSGHTCLKVKVARRCGHTLQMQHTNGRQAMQGSLFTSIAFCAGIGALNKMQPLFWLFGLLLALTSRCELTQIAAGMFRRPLHLASLFSQLGCSTSRNRSRIATTWLNSSQPLVRSASNMRGALGPWLAT